MSRRQAGVPRKTEERLFGLGQRTLANLHLDLGLFKVGHDAVMLHSHGLIGVPAAHEAEGGGSPYQPGAGGLQFPVYGERPAYEAQVLLPAEMTPPGLPPGGGFPAGGQA